MHYEYSPVWTTMPLASSHMDYLHDIDSCLLYLPFNVFVSDLSRNKPSDVDSRMLL